MKLIFFAIILIVAVVSGLIFLFYYLYRKKRFFELRKERRILRDLENGKINASDAEVELSKLKKYRKIAKKEKPLTKAQKRRKLALQIVSMIMVVVVGAVGGFFAGSIYVSSKFNTNYDNFSEAQYRDDVNTVLSSTLNNPSGAKKPYENVGAVNAFVTAEYVLSNKAEFEVTSMGSLQPSIGSKQSVYAYRCKKDGVVYLENISVGMMSVAEKLIYRNNVIEKYSGSNITQTSATWSTTFEEISYDAFKEENGNAVDNPISYVVSSKTATAQSDTPKILANGLYQFSLVLSNDSSVMNYVKQMKRTSGLTSYPTFDSIVLTFTIDENYNFYKITATESYTVVYFGVPAHCESVLTQTFSYDNVASRV